MTKRQPTRIRGPMRFIVLGLLGTVFGVVFAGCQNPLPIRSREHVLPAPYRVAKIPGGTPLRMAMVHDVIHERYFRHSPAWYESRNTAARDLIARTPATSIEHLQAMDDLAVGLDRLDRRDEAMAVLTDKLKLLSPLPDRPTTRFTANSSHSADSNDLLAITSAEPMTPRRQMQYSTLANLGTVRLLAVLPKLMAGHADAAAVAEMRRALDEIERAIEINPGSHFGREKWQAVLMQHLLAAIDHPELLTEFDFIGDKLADSGEGEASNMRVLGRSATGWEEPLTAERRLAIRRSITRVGADDKWVAAVDPDYRVVMPFDESTLAIIGMWTMGGGPNPHFALALGRTMESVGQRQIAWNAYERAVEMQDGFWSDAEVRKHFVAVCRERQAKIENHERESADTMRVRHVAELEWGRQQQRDHDAFEASRIAAGVSMYDPSFDEPYAKSHPPIASDPGRADDVIVTHLAAQNWPDHLACAALGLGIGLALAVVIPERVLS